MVIAGAVISSAVVPAPIFCMVRLPPGDRRRRRRARIGGE
jgi:hypothetical protein